MARYLIVVSLFLLSLINYIDRAAISSSKAPMSAELSLSDQAMGAVFSAFALGYALAQIPAGWFADRFGPRLALTLVTMAWSVFTALTGAVRSLGALLAVRFLFGVAEAGAFPGAARAVFNWLPAGERGRANGILMSGSRIGGAVAFPLMAWLLGRWSWRSAFYLLALPGVAWGALWGILFRNHPRKPPAREAASARAALRFRDVLRSRGMLLNMVQYFSGNFTFFICLSWMLPYLQSRYELSLADAAAYSMIPLLAGGAAQWSSGFLVDLLYHSRLRAWSRRLPAMAGFLLAAGAIFLVSSMESPAAAVACFAVATFGADMTISPSWVYCIDIGGRNSGAVSGSMNMIGNLGSFVSASAFPFLYGLTGDAFAYFAIAALLNMVSVFCWIAMRPPALAPGPA
ncbi:MAG: MFS transporter [Bryobacteraceae bacterium]|nr:MFS transporter [Bryobacteraceae bacterium]